MNKATEFIHSSEQKSPIAISQVLRLRIDAEKWRRWIFSVDKASASSWIRRTPRVRSSLVRKLASPGEFGRRK